MVLNQRKRHDNKRQNRQRKWEVTKENRDTGENEREWKIAKENGGTTENEKEMNGK